MTAYLERPGAIMSARVDETQYHGDEIEPSDGLRQNAQES